MQGCVRESVSLQQLHINLDWVLALLGTLEPVKDGGQIVDSVAKILQRATEPASLAAATDEEKRQWLMKGGYSGNPGSSVPYHQWKFLFATKTICDDKGIWSLF
eukprot:1291682-Amphidinium_carterae.1